GEDRMGFGSNWPVSERFAPLATVVGIVAESFSAHGATARSKFFTRNAQRIYLGPLVHHRRSRNHPPVPASLRNVPDFRLG
ncbi:MAG: hypothetical protein ACKOKG_09810, partial [Verrucomicrobiota bacterium]